MLWTEWTIVRRSFVNIYSCGVQRAINKFILIPASSIVDRPFSAMIFETLLTDSYG
jgi:hypothetical protein